MKSNRFVSCSLYHVITRTTSSNIPQLYGPWDITQRSPYHVTWSAIWHLLSPNDQLEGICGQTRLTSKVIGCISRSHQSLGLSDTSLSIIHKAVCPRVIKDLLWAWDRPDNGQLFLLYKSGHRGNLIGFAIFGEDKKLSDWVDSHL